MSTTAAPFCVTTLSYTLNYTTNVELLWTYLLRSQDSWGLVHSIYPLYVFVLILPLFSVVASLLFFLMNTVSNVTFETANRKRSEENLRIINVWRQCIYIVLWASVIFFFASLYGWWESFVEPTLASLSAQITQDYPSLRNNTDIFSKAIVGTWFGERWTEQVADAISNYVVGIFIPLQILFITRTYPWVVLNYKECVWRISILILLFLIQPISMIYFQLDTCLPLFSETPYGVSGINFVPLGIYVLAVIMCVILYIVYTSIGKVHWNRVYLTVALYTIWITLAASLRFTGILIQLYSAYLIWIFVIAPFIVPRFVFGMSPGDLQAKYVEEMEAEEKVTENPRLLEVFELVKQWTNNKKER